MFAIFVPQIVKSFHVRALTSRVSSARLFLYPYSVSADRRRLLTPRGLQSFPTYKINYCSMFKAGMGQLN